MTPAAFRRIALSLPEAVEGSHMGHADFRVDGKIFATTGWPDEEWGMVKLTREEQELRVGAEPTTFSPVPGNWGLKGSTRVKLATADIASVESALSAAWRGIAPKRLLGGTLNG
jgi:hypothetical protein